jgi:hypothetical protein
MRYAWGMYDLFARPIGSEPPNPKNYENVVLSSPIPAEAYKHRGKWVALHGCRMLAVRDTSAELRKEFGHRHHEVSFFHVPETLMLAR